jgi:two-component system chemotaxis sensor kinase CheA
VDPQEKHELMLTFQVELEEHLATLNKGLLTLEERRPQEEQKPLLENLFRAAHSIKGAARGLDLWDIEMVAHRLEDVLSAIRRGELSPTAELFDAMFPAVDALREALAAHLRGERLPARQRNQLLARLDAALQGAGEQGSGGAGEQGDTETWEHGDSHPHPLSASPLPRVTVSQHEETVRVATAKLDALMDGMGELLVARLRTEQRLRELREIQQRLADWQKNWRRVRWHYSLLQQDSFQSKGARNKRVCDPATLRPGNVAPLLDFLAYTEEHLKTVNNRVDSLVRRFTSDHGRLILVSDDLQGNMRRVRMLPIATLFDIFPRMVRDLAREQGKEVTLRVEGAETEVDRQVVEAMKDPLTHLLRNAVDHGIESPDQREAAGKPRSGTIHLRAAQKGDTILLEVADDGAGIDLEAVRQAAVDRGFLTAQEAAGLDNEEAMQLIFRSGLSTLPRATELSGRGVGLDVVRENLERLHGLIEVSTTCGEGTTVALTLPLTMATCHVLLVEVVGQTVAVPTMSVDCLLLVDAADVGYVEGKPVIRTDERPLRLISLARVLELSQACPEPGRRVEERLDPGQKIPVIVLGAVEKRVAFRVDGFQGIQEVVIKSLGPQLSRVRNVAAVTILGNGEVVVILNVADLMKSAHTGPAAIAPPPVEVREVRRRRVLLVDDSITTRTLEKNILESAGYEVLVAADGEEAWALVQSEPLDAIAADIAMPRMDGFVLTEKVKGDERFKDLPVVLVTSLESPEDKIRGLEAGADAYITKSTFDQLEMLDAIERLIG